MKKELPWILPLALAVVCFPLAADTYKGEQYSVFVTSDGVLQKIMLGTRELFAEEVVSGAFSRTEDGKNVLARIFLWTDYKNRATVEKTPDGWIITKKGTLAESGKQEPLVDFEFTKTLKPRSIQLSYRFVQKTELLFNRPIFASSFRQTADGFAGISIKATTKAGTQYTVFPQAFAGVSTPASGEAVRFSDQNGKMEITVPAEQKITVIDGRGWKDPNAYVNISPSAMKITKEKQLFPAGTVWEWTCTIQIEP